MTLPSVIDNAAMMPRAACAGEPSADAADTTTSIAPSAPTLDVVARNAATHVPDPANASGVHAWNGASDSLKPTPASTSIIATTASGLRAGSANAVMTASPLIAMVPVAANHNAHPSASTANDASAVTSNVNAPCAAARPPRNATRAMLGSVASSRSTSHDARSRAATTPTHPAVADSTSMARTAAR